ncbi:MAG: hypothetical protein QG640_450 [Patescibacteria group bacterium]|nr:hypothetical protein [Patescibacteria group bacterium]
MQNQQSSKKTFFIVIIIIILALAAYFYFKGSPDDSSVSSLEADNSPTSADAQAVGTRVLSLLNQINSLKIDSSIFDSAVYKSLVDYTITIPEQNVGRPNPFAPISGSAPQNSTVRLPSTGN